MASPSTSGSEYPKSGEIGKIIRLSYGSGNVTYIVVSQATYIAAASPVTIITRMSVSKDAVILWSPIGQVLPESKLSRCGGGWAACA